MLFLPDLSRQRRTKYTGKQGPDVPDSPTGHGEERKDFRRQQTQMETGHQMCRTRDRTADRVRGIKQREFALLPECAEYRTSLSARKNQKTRLVVGTNKDLALLRVRGETTREVTLDEDRHEYRTAHVREMTSTPQCAMQRRMERYDAALFQIGATKRTALEPVLRSS